MNALGILSIVWLAFLAMIGLGLGVVYCAGIFFSVVNDLAESYRRRVQPAGVDNTWQVLASFVEEAK